MTSSTARAGTGLHLVAPPAVRPSARPPVRSGHGWLPMRLAPPALPAWHVPRPHLVARLDQAATPVTVVSGPAGAGRTVLLAEWAARVGERDDRLAWCSLHAGDDRPSRFWAVVAAALHHAGMPSIDLAGAEGEARPAAVAEAVATWPRPVTLVLDDLHACRDPQVTTQLAVLLAHLPPGLSVVVGARAPVGVPGLVGLVGAGLATLLDGDLLAFTSVETRQVAARRGWAADDRSIDELHSSTGGWPALVHLAIGGPSPGAARYLDEEVLAPLPPTARAALRRMTVAPHVGASVDEEVRALLARAELVQREGACGAVRLRRGLQMWGAADGPTGAAVPAPAVGAASAGRVEPLTDREQTVLRLLAGPLTLREIGRELYVSRNTVKTHVAGVYRKLGVSDRRGAVVRGRHLGLVAGA